MNFDFCALLNAVAWDETSLGNRSAWPRSLQTLLALLRRSNRPQYLVWGPERRFFYNAAFLPVMGLKHPAGFGMPMDQVWPEVWEDIRPLIDATLDEGVSHFLEDMPFTLRRHGFDELTYFSFSYTPVEDDDEQIAGLMCVLNERTSEVQALSQWRGELDRMHRMFRQAPGFMFVTQGPSHEYVLANEAFERMVGYTHAELLGHTPADLFPEVLEQGYIALLDHVYATGEPFVGRSMPVKLARNDGKQDVLYVDFVHQPIHDKHGSVCGIFTQGADVTDRFLVEAKLRTSEEALRNADARKDRFLAVLGHELRNPLAPIQTAAQILQHMVGSDARALQCADVIARQSRQMAMLVEDLLDIARIKNGLITLKLGDVDVNGVVRDASEQLRWKAAERKHDVRTFLATGDVLVRGDAMRLTQVVSNLLSNAIRYTPESGTIDIIVSRNAGEIRIEVVDSGEGIAPELMPDLFVPFAQESRSSDRINSGLGLGLPLVKSLVDAHGGRVEVASEGRGKGSRFTIALIAI